MKNLSHIWLMSGALLLSAPVQAEFIAVSQYEHHTVYVDMSKLSRNANQVTLPVLHDWAQPHRIYTAYYLSSLTQQVFDCVAHQSRVLAVSYFEKNMRYGKLILRSDDPGTWQPTAAQGLSQQLWQRACSSDE